MKPNFLRLCAVVSLSCSLQAPAYAAAGSPDAGRSRHTLQHDGHTRVYRLYIPGSYREDQPVPLVVVLHGGGGNARQAQRHFRFDAVAEQAEFMVVYPEGIDGHWNDGRKTQKFARHDREIDDVSFIEALLDHLQATYAVDPAKVFATGASNGGMFSCRLGMDLAERFAAIAPIIGGIPEAMAPGFSPSYPISVLIMQGTDDPAVPYAGGPVAPNAFMGLKQRVNRGRVIGTEEALSMWLRHNGLTGEPVVGEMEDVNTTDGVKTKTYLWTGGEGGSAVLFMKMVGAGHTMPGGSQYLPKRMIGASCRDFDAAEEIWAFFEQHPAARDIGREYHEAANP